MIGRCVVYVFFVAVAITAVYGQGISIVDTTVTLSCPTDMVWDKSSTKQEENSNTFTISNYNEKQDGLYYCTSDTDQKDHHYFYIKAKVCKGCVDLDMMVAVAVVAADVIITVGIVLLVYFCSKSRAGTAAPQRATPRQQRGAAKGPTPPDPDYQELNPATRSNDVYAQAQRR